MVDSPQSRALWNTGLLMTICVPCLRNQCGLSLRHSVAGIAMSGEEDSVPDERCFVEISILMKLRYFVFKDEMISSEWISHRFLAIK